MGGGILFAMKKRLAGCILLICLLSLFLAGCNPSKITVEFFGYEVELYERCLDVSESESVLYPPLYFQGNTLKFRETPLLQDSASHGTYYGFWNEWGCGVIYVPYFDQLGDTVDMFDTAVVLGEEHYFCFFVGGDTKGEAVAVMLQPNLTAEEKPIWRVYRLSDCAEEGCRGCNKEGAAKVEKELLYETQTTLRAGYLDGDTYYFVTNDGICRWKEGEEALTPLKTETSEALWRSVPPAMTKVDNRIYVITPDGVYEYDLVTEGEKLYAYPDWMTTE